MNPGGKRDPDLVGALQRGMLDAAAETLKHIHDTRDAALRLAARQRVTAPTPALHAGALGLSGVAYELAQLQGEMVSRLLGIRQRHASAVQRRVETALGLGTSEAPSAALRGEGPGPAFALRFRVKNSRGADGSLSGALVDGVLTDGDGTRHVTRASLQLPSVLDPAGVLPASAVTLVTLHLECPSAAAGDRLQGRYTVTVDGAAVLSLHLDVHVTAGPP